MANVWVQMVTGTATMATAVILTLNATKKIVSTVTIRTTRTTTMTTDMTTMTTTTTTMIASMITPLATARDISSRNLIVREKKHKKMNTKIL